MWGYLLGIVLGSIILLLMFFIFCFLFFKHLKHLKNLKIIGLKAQAKININIMTWAKHTKNFFISNSLFKYHKNKIFEVDGILITPHALFVIEIKSVKGEIIGDVHRSFWIKKINNQQQRMSNPVFQNEKHIAHIIKMINFKIPVISFIIFSNRTDHIRVKNIPSHVAIFKQNQLFEKLDDIEKSLPSVFTDYEMRTIYGQIKAFKTTKKSDIRLFKKYTNQNRYWWK